MLKKYLRKITALRLSKKDIYIYSKHRKNNILRNFNYFYKMLGDLIVSDFVCGQNLCAF